MLQPIVAIVLIVISFGLIGWTMIWSLKWARNRDGRKQIAVGNAVRELDRLITRPSIENLVNTKAEVKPVDDAHGGE